MLLKHYIYPLSPTLLSLKTYFEIYTSIPIKCTNILDVSVYKQTHLINANRSVTSAAAILLLNDNKFYNPLYCGVNI